MINIYIHTHTQGKQSLCSQDPYQGTRNPHAEERSVPWGLSTQFSYRRCYEKCYSELLILGQVLGTAAGTICVPVRSPAINQVILQSWLFIHLLGANSKPRYCHQKVHGTGWHLPQLPVTGHPTRTKHGSLNVSCLMSGAKNGLG